MTNQSAGTFIDRVPSKERDQRQSQGSPKTGGGLTKSWLGKFQQSDKWSFCLTAARMAADQERDDDETSAPEPQPGIQGESGSGRHQWGEDVGRVGAAIRRSRQSDHAMEGAASGRGGRDIRVRNQGRCRRTDGGFEVAPCEDRRVDAG